MSPSVGLAAPKPHPPVDVIFDEDFIVIYQGLEPSLCQSVVQLFDRDEGKWRGKIGRSGDGFQEDDATKFSWDLEIRNEGVWADVFQQIHPPIMACLSEYLLRSPILQSFPLEATGYKIQMYPKNEGYFEWHADSMGGNAGNRVVAMVLYLNDVETGGETEFFHQDFKISPKAGQLVLFPTGWNYMHCARVPESGAKYIISAFVRVKP